MRASFLEGVAVANDQVLTCVCGSLSSLLLTIMADNWEKGCEKNRSKSWVKLNVGGTHFLTTTTTLSRDPKSFLARLIIEDPELPTDKVSALL